MIQGINAGSVAHELFLNATNEYVGKLLKLSDGIRPDNPRIADLLQAFGQVSAGRALDMTMIWTSGLTSRDKQQGKTDGIQQSA